MVQNLFGMHKSGNHLLATMPPIWRLVYSNILFESVSRVTQYIYKELLTLCTGCPHPVPATDAAMWQIPKWEIQNKRKEKKTKATKFGVWYALTLLLVWNGKRFLILVFIFTGFIYTLCECVCCDLDTHLRRLIVTKASQVKREERSNQDTVATLKHRQHRRLARWPFHICADP